MTRSSNCAATASYSWATRQQESCARYSRLRCGTRVSPLPPPPFFESKVLYLKLIVRSRSVHNYIADSYGKIKCQRSAYACRQSAGRTFPAYRSRLDYYSTNWFVSTGTNSMECLTNWIPLRIRVRSRNNQPHLKENPEDKWPFMFQILLKLSNQFIIFHFWSFFYVLIVETNLHDTLQQILFFGELRLGKPSNPE